MQQQEKKESGGWLDEVDTTTVPLVEIDKAALQGGATAVQDLLEEDGQEINLEDGTPHERVNPDSDAVGNN